MVRRLVRVARRALHRRGSGADPLQSVLVPACLHVSARDYPRGGGVARRPLDLALCRAARGSGWCRRPLPFPALRRDRAGADRPLHGVRQWLI